MPDIFVIAEEEIVLAFRMVGVDGCAVGGREEALDAFKRATSRSRTGGPAAGHVGSGKSDLPKVLVLTEETSDLLEGEVRDWQLTGDYPLIVEIPAQSGNAVGRKSIVDAVREAVGVMI